MNDPQANQLHEGPVPEELPTQETLGKRPNWDFTGKPVRVLFLCTHNQARSQIAEALTHDLSRGQVEVLSEGNHPAAQVHPMAVHAIARLGANMSRHVPNPWISFASRRLIASSSCAIWAIRTVPPSTRLGWSIGISFPDPTLVEGTEQERQCAFNLLATELSTRIRLLLTLLEKEKRAST